MPNYTTTISLKQLFATPKENGALTDGPPLEEADVCYAAWLSEDVLLLAGSLRSMEQEAPTVVVSSGYQTDPGPTPAPEALWFSGTASCDLLLLSGIGTPVEEIRFQTTAGQPAGTDVTMLYEITDLQTLVRDRLAGLQPEVRGRMLAWFTESLLGSRAVDRRLVKNLRFLREALRERLLICKVDKNEPQGMHIGTLLAVDEQTFYVRGWMWDAEADVVRLTAESPEGVRMELLDTVVRHPRPDIAKMYGGISTNEPEEQPGFISYFQTHAPSYIAQGWIFEMQNSEGLAIQIDGPGLIRDLSVVRRKILADLNAQRKHSPNLLERHIHPALQQVQARYLETVKVDHVYQYGTPPASPDASVIIPLYKRIDFIEHQMAQFVHDAYLAETDLMYVLDSPHLADRLTVLAAQLYRLYGVPFRVVILNQNAGVASARNLGASLARGRKLLLFDSDVLPDKPGWLGTMTAFYEATPKIGALGPKLLFEDEALQHAGVHFYKRAEDEEWERAFYFKGLHRRFPGANVARPVPAVTGACLMISRDLYEQMGGLQTQYIQGGYEDADLCLRLQEAGYENWYLPEAELYHLENQSYTTDEQDKVLPYNHWLHTRRWRDVLEARYDASVP